MNSFSRYCPVCLLTFVLLCHFSAFGQWSTKSSQNNPASVLPYVQWKPAIAEDGKGGAIIAWADGRSGTNYDIYVQRINASGVGMWAANGVAVCSTLNDQVDPRIIPDGNGGAVIVWLDDRLGASAQDVFAQRFDSSGAALWTANGVAICIASLAQGNLSLVSDGTGGAFVAWDDLRATNYNIYAQRINGAGSPLWAADGLVISGGVFQQIDPAIAPDDSGGVYIVWMDRRNGSNYEIYAQRVIGSGAVQWIADGALIITAPNDQLSPSMVADGLGGAILTWSDFRFGVNYDIFAQRIGRTGSQSWTTGGVAVSTAAFSQTTPVIVSDGAGGCIIAWEDQRSGVRDVYAQRLVGSGYSAWTSNGTALCTDVGEQNGISIVGDGLEGAIVVWNDFRTGTADIHAQHVDYAGSSAWITDGVPVSTAGGGQLRSGSVSDGQGGVIVTWDDERSGVSLDVYAQNLDRVGYPGDARPVIASVKDIGNDQGGSVSLTWMPSYIDEWPSTTITEYAIYRGVGLNSALPSSAGFTPAGKSRVKIDGESERGASSFLAPLTAGGTDTIFWQNIGSVGAEWLGGYLFNAQTPSDSGAGGNPVSYFMVRARTSSPAVFWSSAPDSGYSVDNLPPSIVTGLVAELEPGPAVSLAWDKNPSDTDFGSYEVYRSPAGGVTISGIKIGETTDTTFTDASPVIGLVNSYYVIAVDIHGNKGAPSVEAGVPVGITVQYSVMDKWNMISVPLTVADYSATVLYSAAVSNVYAFEGAYTVKSTLTNGQGYWVKFNGSQNVGLTGLLRESDSLQVQAGWNLIGSVSGSVPTATIASTPSGIVTSQFFAYNGSYAPSSTIDAGKGYWVKATQSGTLYLSSAQNTPVASRIRIVPTDDTPPSPPDADGGRMVPAEYLLEQNYPNPFNPFTEIRYGIPEDMNVRLDVFNPLGELVATLVHRDVPAGFHVQGWEASDLPSGVYLLRLTAGSFRGTKKMVLLR